jgi:Ca2+-transporting ATPase
VNRSWRHTIFNSLHAHNRALWWVIAGAFGFLVLVIRLPMLNDIFHFAPLSLWQFLFCLTVGMLSVTWFELYKRFSHRYTR